MKKFLRSMATRRWFLKTTGAATLAPGRSGMSGAIHPLASGLPARSENACHPRQFRVHLGDPGLSKAAQSRAIGTKHSLA